MINQVKIRFFKRFQEEVFNITDNVILAGPNNAGKTTFLTSVRDKVNVTNLYSTLNL